MSRRLRYQPEEWMVHSVTLRCIQGRYLLLPTDGVSELMVGVLERAALRTEVELHAASALSNHMHLVVSARSAAALSSYMEYVAGNLSRELGRLHDWPGKLWHCRYFAAPCLDEASQLGCLGYVLAQGVKERLVNAAYQWPGLHTWRATVRGERLRGYWVNRTALYNAGRRVGERPQERDFREPCTLTLHKLPALAHLDDAAYAAEADRLYREAVAARLPEERGKVLGVKALLRLSPHTRPAESEKTVAPRCHAASRVVRGVFLAAYAAFVEAYREAMHRLREVGRALFPPGGVLPAGLRPEPP